MSLPFWKMHFETQPTFFYSCVVFRISTHNQVKITKTNSIYLGDISCNVTIACVGSRQQREVKKKIFNRWKMWSFSLTLSSPFFSCMHIKHLYNWHNNSSQKPALRMYTDVNFSSGLCTWIVIFFRNFKKLQHWKLFFGCRSCFCFCWDFASGFRTQRGWQRGRRRGKNRWNETGFCDFFMRPHRVFLILSVLLCAWRVSQLFFYQLFVYTCVHPPRFMFYNINKFSPSPHKSVMAYLVKKLEH